MRQLNIRALIVYIVGLISIGGIVFAAIFISNGGFNLKPEDNISIVNKVNVNAYSTKVEIKNSKTIAGNLKSSENLNVLANTPNNKKINAGKLIQNASKIQSISSSSPKIEVKNGQVGLLNTGNTNYANTKVSSPGSKLYASSTSLSNSGSGIANGSKIGSVSKSNVISSTQFKSGQKQSIGGPPPSEHGEPSPSLPLGDGWILMLLFAGGYAVMKLNSKTLGI